MAYDVVLGCSQERKSSVSWPHASAHGVARSLVRRLALTGVALFTFVACDGLPGGLGGGAMIPPPRAGIASSFEQMMVDVPGAKVNASGGNLHVMRDDMNIDTRIGSWKVGAVWNSATGQWLWNFNTSMKPTPAGHRIRFIDSTGRAALMGKTSLGKPVGGTHWTKHASDAMRTNGGLIYHFDANGHLASVNWASADYPRLEFVRASWRMKTIEQCRNVGDCHTLFTMTHDVQGRLTSIVDLAGRTSVYTYDGDSPRIATAQDPLDIANGWPGFRYEYDDENRLVAITNSHDERVEYEYYGPTKSIFKVKQVGEGDPLWAFAYEGLDGYWLATTTVVDPVGAATSFRFDTSKRLFRRTNGNNESWKWRYEGSSYARTSEESSAGVKRLFATSGLDVSTETHPNGNVVTTTFAPWPAENREDPTSRAVLSIADSLGSVETRVYSASGVLESVANGEGDTTSFASTPGGDYVVTDPSGVVTTYGNRGDHGHYSSATQSTKTVNYTYDVVGNLLSADGLLDEPRYLAHDSIGQGGIVGRFYDADRNVAGLILDDGGLGAQGLLSSLNVSWRADHKRTLIARPYGGDTEFLYDALGRKRETRTRVDGAWSTTVYERDARGAVTAILKPNGMATRYAYRPAGDVVSITHEQDWADPLEVDSHAGLVYAGGRLVEIRDSAHGMMPESYYYDANGQLAQVGYPGGESLVYDYDLRGRASRSQFVRPDLSVLRTFDYDYDLAGRMTSVDEDGASILDATYTNGQTTGALYGNGVAIVNSFDPETGAMTGLTATNAAQQVIASMVVNSTTCGILLPTSPCKVEQTDSYVGAISSSYAEYQVEDQGSERLIADSHGLLQPTDTFYSYDELSNVQQSAAGSFVYNAERNRLLSIEDQGTSAVDYVYDAAGYVVSRNGVEVTWNGMGRVLSAGADLSIQWDTLGRRVSLVVAGDETHWRYGESLIEDEFGSNQSIDLGWAVSRIDEGTHEYRVSDFRGNAKLIFDDLGEVSAHHSYSGYRREGTMGVDETSTGFAMGTHAGDLVVMGQRIYDPISRRFMSEDPIFQTVNQFVYTLGNPVRFWDPGGDDSWRIKSVTVSTGLAGPVPMINVSITWEPVGEASSPAAVGGGSQPAGSTGAGGANGGTGSGGSQGMGTGNQGGGLGPLQGCGLGFEIVPILMTWFALSRRRRARSQA